MLFGFELLIIVQQKTKEMLDYSFLEILESLSREELRSFRRFILSPYFNRSPKLLRLFDIIAKYHPNFENRNLTKEKLHEKITPELPYNEITMRRLLFDLQKLAEKFMIQMNFERKNAESGIALIEELARRGTPKMHSMSLNNQKKAIESVPFIDSDLCMSKFRLETEDFYFGVINNKINRKNFVSKEANKLINGLTYLISYFLLEAVKHNDVLLTYSRDYNVKHNIKFISQFIDLFDFERLRIFMKTSEMKGASVVELYLNTLRAFLYFENNEYYFSFKKSLRTHRDELSPDDLNHLYGKLASYCIMKNSQNEKDPHDFEYELFDIYKEIVSNKYYVTHSNSYIPVDLFRNIILQSIKVKELSWMEDFIQNNGRMLHPNRMNDIMSYSYAMLNFHRNVFDRSLEFLSRIKEEEFVFRMDVRNLYLMNYFELRQYDTALSLIKAHKKFIKENKIVNDETRIHVGNFLKFMQKLVNFQSTDTKTDLKILKLQLERSSRISNRQWLLGKVEELSKSARRAV